MYGSSGYYKETRPYSSNRVTRVLSPQVHKHRPSPKLFTNIFSPKSSQTSEIDSTSIADFINLMQEQLKRISESFSFSYSTDPPLVQAIEYIAQAVDYLIEEKTKTLEEKHGNFDGSKEKYARLDKDELEKAKETTKRLCRYEHLLKKKEEKLEEEKNKFKTELKHLKEAETELKSSQFAFENQEKTWAETRKYEQEKLKIDREEADKRLAEAKDMKERLEKKFEDATKQLRFEKESLLQLESFLLETKQNLALEQKKNSSDKLEVEKEKWRIEQRERKNDENEIMIQMKNERFEQEREELENEKMLIKNCRAQLEEEKLEMGLLRESKRELDSRISERNTKMLRSEKEEEEEGKNMERYEDLEAKAHELEERENEIEEAYRELQEQMDNFNKELEERESALEERDLYLAKAEREFSMRMEAFRKIETSLNESKLQLEDLRVEAIPNLEIQSEMIESLVKVLNIKKNEMEMALIKLEKEIDLVHLHGKQKNPNITEENESDDSAPEALEELTKDLEFKMNFLREREEELNKAEENLENEREQVVRTAEFLKKAHLDVEEQKLQYDKEIFEEKEKIKNHFLKLESGMHLLANREAEVQAYKKKVEEKENLLREKEKELEKKLEEFIANSPDLEGN